MSDEKSSREASTSEERRTRQPLGVMRKKLSLDKKTRDMLKKEGLVPRMVNDDNHGERIRDAIAGGYDFISSDGELILGDTVVRKELNMRVRKTVGTNKDGSPKFAYLMAIRRDFYEEDQARKEEQNKMVDEAIRGGNPTGLKDHGVTPDKGGTNIKNIVYEP